MGFGPIANVAFPDPTTGEFRKGYEQLGKELEELLSEEELRIARQSTPNAFYTDHKVMEGIYGVLSQEGVRGPVNALEPGCGIGNFMGIAPEGYKFVGVEREGISARISRLLYPVHTILYKDYQDVDKLSVDKQPILQDNSVDVRGREYSFWKYKTAI